MTLPACKPLQRLENSFRKRQNPFVGNDTSGMAKPRIRAFLRLLGLCCLNDKTSHRFQDENKPLSILITDSGIVIEVSDVQYLNANPPMLVIDLPKEILKRLEQPSNILRIDNQQLIH